MDFKTLIEQYGPTPDGRYIVIDIPQQELHLFERDRCLLTRVISTAANGAGNRQDSLKTPTGAHRIAEKIGADALPCTLFVGRQNSGELAEKLLDARSSGKDQITSRILWLTGIEQGINLGGDVDTYNRYIYIHGTPEEGLIGEPVSHGCVRMKNDDIIELFDLIEPQTLVYIAP